MKPVSPVLFVSFVAAILGLTGCGQSDKPSESAHAQHAAAAASAPAAPAASAEKPKSGRAVAITANDTMKFSVTEIHAKPGEALAVTLTNEGTVPKFSMGHNWVLMTAGTDLNAVTAAAIEAATTEYIPASFKDRILASTKLLGPKESDTALFYAPKQPGRYPFLCTYPGHMQVGMKGELIVE
ncbi:azurin [Opitutaceae bacterium EW11]|nr:azurin [Opitutaceae bacterium EW11]